MTVFIAFTPIDGCSLHANDTGAIELSRKKKKTRFWNCPELCPKFYNRLNRVQSFIKAYTYALLVEYQFLYYKLPTNVHYRFPYLTIAHVDTL